VVIFAFARASGIIMSRLLEAHAAYVPGASACVRACACARMCVCVCVCGLADDDPGVCFIQLIIV
jgi:hypothetical protein